MYEIRIYNTRDKLAQILTAPTHEEAMEAARLNTPSGWSWEIRGVA